MGVSNSEMFLSEKDTMELSFLVRPPLEEFQQDCQIAPNFQDVVVNDHDDEPQQQQQQKQERVLQEDEAKSKLLMKIGSLLELKSPSPGEFKVADHEDENDDDGFKTPTSLDHKIPVVLKCPPAPKKPKSVPTISQKRKALRKRILLDLTKEIESLFPPALIADLGNKIKKVRQGSDFK